MSFFIWWGENYDAEPRHAAVVDMCPRCLSPQAFNLEDVMLRSHVYGVSIGAGAHRGTVMTCYRCHQTFDCQLERYAELLPASAVYELSLEQGLGRCLPSLASMLATIDALARGQQESVYRGEPPDDDLDQVVKLLRQLALASTRVEEQVSEAARWSELNDKERGQLLGELKGMVRGAGLDAPPASPAPAVQGHDYQPDLVDRGISALGRLFSLLFETGPRPIWVWMLQLVVWGCAAAVIGLMGLLMLIDAVEQM